LLISLPFEKGNSGQTVMGKVKNEVIIPSEVIDGVEKSGN